MDNVPGIQDGSLEQVQTRRKIYRMPFRELFEKLKYYLRTLFATYNHRLYHVAS